MALLATGCGGSSTSSPTGTPIGAAARATVGAVELRVEVARTPEQKEQGLRGREVPLGAGMAFPYDPARPVRFTMSRVDRPLVGVFARAGRAVAVERMAPCTGSVAQCPTYGPGEPVDLVVEAAPESLPDARAGDPVALRGG